MCYFVASQEFEGEPSVNRKTQQVPSFTDREAAQTYWVSNSRSRNVPNKNGKYGNMSKEQAKVAFDEGRADLFVRKDMDSEVELYQVVQVREKYEEYREQVRLLNIELHAWVTEKPAKT